MSRNRDNYYNNNRDRYNDGDRNRNRDYYRSRQKNNDTWNRDKNQDNYNNRRHQNNNNRGNWNQNNSYNRNRQRNQFSYQYDNENQVIRQVCNVIVPDPQQFVIGQNPKFVNQSLPKFTIKIIKAQKPPTKPQSKVDKLKGKITPIQKIWTSTIKQYLNDSQFVQIYRKGKSLAYGDIQYGKSIINYDEGDKSMHYENQTSQSKIFSRAYFKIWEILEMGIFKGKQNQSLKIGSVAEGPGGFIHAMIDYRLKNSQKKDRYYAITLRISENTRNAKDWSDFRGKAHFDSMRDIGYKIKLSYGQTGNGDLLKQQNIDFFADHDLQGQKCYLVTGDGGIECIGDQQFDYQQVFNVKLFLGEILTALKIQQLGGKFILKIYDCCFQLTTQLLSLLCIFYKKVRIVKPVTSRPGNSQKYMLCQDFIGMSKQQENSLKQLLSSWTQIQQNLTYFQNKQFVTSIIDFSNFANYKQIIQNLRKANQHFNQQQVDKLQEGIKLAQDNQNDVTQIQEILKQRRYKQQLGYAYKWCKKYGLSHIAVKQEENIKKIQTKKQEQTSKNN